MNLRPLLLLECCFAILLSASSNDTHADTAPWYASAENVNRPVGQTFGTPEDDARPGAHFSLLATSAVAKKDYVFAVGMYKVAASWAYKTAEYNLAIMYAKGEGVPVDRPLAMAWAALAAERGDPEYVTARDVIYRELSQEEFARANEIWRTLKKSFGDDVALTRAKWRWADVRNNQTGTHAGGVTGHVLVGGGRKGGSPKNNDMENGMSNTPFGPVQGGSVDATIAYRQMHESDNPYDPKFEWRESPNRTGTAIVDPLIPAGDAPEQPGQE